MQTYAMDQAEIDFFAQLQSLIHSAPTSLPKTFSSICGVDAAYSKEGNRVASAATLLFNGRLVETSTYIGMFTFPYVSGLFYLHEGPFVVAAVRKLENKPALVCFNAHGSAHPRSKGLAVICGMILGIPSIGIAKKRLVGNRVPYKSGVDKIELWKETVGFATSRGKKKYWSLGYSVSLSRLERVISDKHEECMIALEEAHRLARETILKED